MGRDGLYGLLGEVWLSDSEEYREKLIKEALKRGSGEERQRFSQIQQHKTVIVQRLQEIATAQEALNLREKQNVLPQKPISSPLSDKYTKTLGLPTRSGRSRQEEADSDAKRQQYTAALQAYNAQNIVILSDRLKHMAEYLALQSEYASLEETEKWLLLSMTIKNQSSLLGYMQGS